MSQQPPPQPQQVPYGHPQWGQQAPSPYGSAPTGNSPLLQQPPQGQQPSSQAQWGQQVPLPSTYGRVPVENPPPQQPFPWTAPYPEAFQPPSFSPNTSPQSNQRDLRPWYKRQGGGVKIALVCGLLVAVLLLGYGLTIAWGSLHGSTPPASPSPTGQRAATSATTTPSPTPTPTPTHKLKPSKTVVMVSRADFSPATLTIAVGSTVIWKNTSQVAHTVTSDDGTFDSGNLPAGGTFRFTFTTPGKFDYTCNYHPWMTGTIIVQ